MQILTENCAQERKISTSQTAVEITILRYKTNEDITEELERNIETQFQLQKKWQDAENDKQKS